jgi:ubiquinone/menaquinone biosynthesis C-methylase UbiE
MLAFGVMRLLGYETLIDPLLKDMRTFTAEFADINSGDRILDVCCGTGAQIFEYAQRGPVAVGIDNDPAMLRVATGNRIKQKEDSISFQLADATSLPFKDSYFDCVSISFGLHDKIRQVRNRVVNEMKRVVKQHGALILADYQVPLPRNIWAIAARGIESLANGSHYEGFKDYLSTGGLDGILRAHDLREEKRACVKSGLVVIVKAKKI